MSQTSISSANPVPEAPVYNYELSDDLARLCLPAEYKDACRTLAWVNSICFLFLVVGLIGLKAPRIVMKPLSEIVEPLPVELPQPEAPPPQVVQAQPDETPPETPTEAPQVVAPVVAAADPAQVAFAVPVVGAVPVTNMKLVTAPPPANLPATTLTRFDPNAMRGGSFPEILYPGMAQRNGWQGVATVTFKVDTSGHVIAVDLQKSSGFPILDKAAFEAVTNRWRFPAGSPGYFVKDFEFKLNR